MTEWRLSGEVVPYVSTREFHANRERGPAGGWRIEKKASVAGGFQVVLASPEGVNLP